MTDQNRRWTDKITSEWVGLYTAMVMAVAFLAGFAYGKLF